MPRFPFGIAFGPEQPKPQKFKVGKASDWEYEAVVEIESLDALRNLAILHGCGRLIIDFAIRSPRAEPQGSITIYDDYVE